LALFPDSPSSAKSDAETKKIGVSSQDNPDGKSVSHEPDSSVLPLPASSLIDPDC
jgi:hypothetical protein